MPHKFERGMIGQVSDVALAAREKVIEGDYFMSIAQQAITKMASQESGSPCNQNTHSDIETADLSIVPPKNTSEDLTPRPGTVGQ